MSFGRNESRRLPMKTLKGKQSKIRKIKNIMFH